MKADNPTERDSMFKYSVVVVSINRYGEVEWRESCRAMSYSAACRKAYKVVKGCGFEGTIIKRNYSATSIWELR